MEKHRISKKRWLVIGSALVMLAGGVAFATIPGPGGVIQGCYNARNGQLSVVDSSAACGRNEIPLSWNQQGPAGPQGPIGPQGPPGGGQVITAEALQEQSLVLGSQFTLAHLDLPPGNWLVVGKVNLINDVLGAQQIVCQINGSRSDQGFFYATVPGATASLTMVFPETDTSGGIDLACSTLGAARAFGTRIIATQASSITLQ